MAGRSSKSVPTTLETSLQLQLQWLSLDLGLQRADLVELLRGDLRDLYAHWELSRFSSSDSVRKEVAERIKSYCAAIPAGSTVQTATPERQEKFLYFIDLSFNINLNERNAKLRKNARQKLAQRAPDHLRASFETVRDDLNFAYVEIEKQMLKAGCKPCVPVSELKKKSPGLRDSSTPSPPSGGARDATIHQPTPPAPEPQSKKRRRWITIASTVVVVAALGIIGYVVTSPSDDDPETYISVENSPIDYKLGQTTSPDLVIPHPLSEIERPPPYDGVNLTEFDAWKVKYGAVRANTMHITFIARGMVSEPTIIEGADIDVVRREAPLAGTWIKPDGGDQGPVRQLYGDLDQRPMVLRDDGTWQYPLRVSNTDPEVFTVTVHTINCHCYWRVMLKVNLPSNKSAKIIVDDDGKPFEITSSTAVADQTYLAYGPGDAWPRPVP